MAVVTRLLEQAGEDVTLRRVTGTQRVAFDVHCRAGVTVGAVNPLVGSIQQTDDQIILTSVEMQAARLPIPPRHGDLLIYADGRSTMIEGRPRVVHLEDGEVYVVRVTGG